MYADAGFTYYERISILIIDGTCSNAGEMYHKALDIADRLWPLKKEFVMATETDKRRGLAVPESPSVLEGERLIQGLNGVVTALNKLSYDQKVYVLKAACALFSIPYEDVSRG